MECSITKNYVPIQKFSLLCRGYAYVDVPEYYADQLFNKHRVHIEFDAEYAHPEFGYRVITCYVYRWERKRFETVMKELVDKMAENGKGDYLNFCEKLFSQLKST